MIRKIQENVQRNIESLNTIQEQMLVDSEFTNKIKKDLLENHIRIKEELNEKDYKQICNYY
jgi:uncharacterized iron-regulated protein